MAQKIVTTLVDDVDGGEAHHTIPFSLDGVTYEIDLSDKNADKLRETFRPYLLNGRRMGGRVKGGQNGGRGSSVKPGVDLSEVRAWAKQNGYQVSERGRVAAEVLDAYDNRTTGNGNVKGAQIPGVVIPKPSAPAPAPDPGFSTAPQEPSTAPQTAETGEGDPKPKPTRKRAASKTTTVKRGNL